jgi:hypothetical protein
MLETVTDVPVEERALGVSGEQLVEDCGGDSEVAVDATVAKLQIEDRLVGMVENAGQQR